MTRTALLTGATGFIGSTLSRHLANAGWRLHLLVRRTGERAGPPAIEHPYDGSLPSLVAALERAQAEVVFHLASLYLADHRPDQVDDLVTSNVLLPAQLAEAMAQVGPNRLVNTGTAWQHFDSTSYRPVNLYAATKQAAQDMLDYYHHARGLSVVTLKLFDTYGPGDTRRKLVQLLAEAALAGEPIGISPGEQLVDLTHVDDVVAGFSVAAARLLESPHAINETFFLAGERQSVRELVERVGRALARPVPVQLGARPYRPREVMRPVVPEPLLPGWRPLRSLDTAVLELARQEGE